MVPIAALAMPAMPTPITTSSRGSDVLIAAAADIALETVRCYEQRGLLARPERERNGYRTYDDGALLQLRFIRAAQAAGPTLAEIRSVIELGDDGDAPCRHVDALLADKLSEVRDKQRQLAVLELELVGLLERSATLHPSESRPDGICHVIPAPGPR